MFPFPFIKYISIFIVVIFVCITVFSFLFGFISNKRKIIRIGIINIFALLFGLLLGFLLFEFKVLHSTYDSYQVWWEAIGGKLSFSDFNILLKPLLFTIGILIAFIATYLLFSGYLLLIFIYNKRKNHQAVKSNQITISKKIIFGMINIFIFLPFNCFFISTLSIFEKNSNFISKSANLGSSIFSFNKAKDPHNTQTVVLSMINIFGNNFSYPLTGYCFITFNPNKINKNNLDAINSYSTNDFEVSQSFFNNKDNLNFYFLILSNKQKSSEFKFDFAEFKKLFTEKIKFKKIKISQDVWEIMKNHMVATLKNNDPYLEFIKNHFWEII